MVHISSGAIARCCCPASRINLDYSGRELQKSLKRLILYPSGQDAHTERAEWGITVAQASRLPDE